MSKKHLNKKQMIEMVSRVIDTEAGPDVPRRYVTAGDVCVMLQFIPRKKELPIFYEVLSELGEPKKEVVYYGPALGHKLLLSYPLAVRAGAQR